MPSEFLRAGAGRMLRRALRLQCPRCAGAKLFTGWFAMARACPLCGLRFERAPGYFVGAIYLNYGVTVGVIAAASFALWRYAKIGLSAQLWLWIPFAVAFPMWFFRYSRSLWLGIEYTLNPDH